jgi:hypothetical protein
MNPMRAEVEGHPENRQVGQAAAADTIARLEQDKAAIGGGNAPRRCNARRSRTNDRHIRFSSGLGAHDRGRRDKRRGGSEE